MILTIIAVFIIGVYFSILTLRVLNWLVILAINNLQTLLLIITLIIIIWMALTSSKKSDRRLEIQLKTIKDSFHTSQLAKARPLFSIGSGDDNKKIAHDIITDKGTFTGKENKQIYWYDQNDSPLLRFKATVLFKQEKSDDLKLSFVNEDKFSWPKDILTFPGYIKNKKDETGDKKNYEACFVVITATNANNEKIFYLKYLTLSQKELYLYENEDGLFPSQPYVKTFKEFVLSNGSDDPMLEDYLKLFDRSGNLKKDVKITEIKNN